MYATSTGGAITKAGMDGSNPMPLITGLLDPHGIVIDFSVSRLFWAEAGLNAIQSSNLAGGDIRKIVTLPASSGPVGLAIHGNKLYWGTHTSKLLQSSTKTGENIRTLYTSASLIEQVTLATKNLTRTRRNHCDGQSCLGVCVLTTTAHRCLN